MSGGSVTIGTIDSRVEPDMYRRDTNGASSTELYIDPSERRASILQWWPGANSTTMNEWLGLKLSYKLDITPDEYLVREYLKSNEAQALLVTICDGHGTEWDGSNWRGWLTREAIDAAEELVGELNSLPASDWSLWTVSEWFDGEVPDELTATTTDEDIAVLAAMYEAIAGGDHVVLNGSVIDYLTECRGEMREEEEA